MNGRAKFYKCGAAPSYIYRRGRLFKLRSESMPIGILDDVDIKKFELELSRGDIVVITEPNYFDEPLIKRVIAKGGETVNIDFTTGTVYVDGVALKEPYTREDYILPKLDDIEFPYTVPEGHIFCMGDNRNGSTDSRSNLIGPLDERYVLGKAVIRILPFGDFDIYDYE